MDDGSPDTRIYRDVKTFSYIVLLLKKEKRDKCMFRSVDLKGFCSRYVFDIFQVYITFIRSATKAIRGEKQSFYSSCCCQTLLVVTSKCFYIYPIKFSSKLVEIHPRQLSINTGPWKHPSWTLMTSVRFSSARRKLRKVSCWERSKRWMWMVMASFHTVNWRRPLPLWVA